jgi:hypothetical protein
MHRGVKVSEENVSARAPHKTSQIDHILYVIHLLADVLVQLSHNKKLLESLYNLLIYLCFERINNMSK